MLPKKKHAIHQDPFRFPLLQEPIENEVLALFSIATKNMLMGVSKLLVEKVKRGDDIQKSMHKYIRKEPDGKGGWSYIYEESKFKRPLRTNKLKEKVKTDMAQLDDLLVGAKTFKQDTRDLESRKDVLANRLQIIESLEQRNQSLSESELRVIQNNIKEAKSISEIENQLLGSSFQKVSLSSKFNVATLKQASAKLIDLLIKYKVDPNLLSLTSIKTTNPNGEVAHVTSSTIMTGLSDEEASTHFPNVKKMRQADGTISIFAPFVEIALTTANVSQGVNWFSHKPDFIDSKFYSTSGFHPRVNNAVDDIMTHEFCHVLQNLLYSEEERKELRARKDVENAVSTYAKKNGMEMEAEAFVLYDNGDRSEKVVKSLENLIPRLTLLLNKK